MKNVKQTSFAGTAAVAGAALAIAVMLQTPAQAQDSKTYVMKLSTATLNDTQHEWMKRFAAAVEKDSGGRIKGEVYPASQLGAIPRQIEGTQFGAIQAWIGPPEFLVGIDERFECLSAPGLITTQEQDVRVVADPAVRNLLLGMGGNKGLTGIGLFPLAASAIATAKPESRLADFKGLKIRVLASPFQLEMIKRMDASPVAMSLADVLPALQQGAVDGALGTVSVFGPLHYIDAAKYVTQIGQPYVNSIVEMNKKWLDGLPADLQKIVRDDAAKIDQELVPFINQFDEAQLKAWTEHGGQLLNFPADEQAMFLKKIGDIGDTMSKDKPALNAAVKVVAEAAARDK